MLSPKLPASVPDTIRTFKPAPSASLAKLFMSRPSWTEGSSAPNIASFNGPSSNNEATSPFLPVNCSSTTLVITPPAASAKD